MQAENKYSVDFHAHILPNADHGSDSVETSLYQLEQAKKTGITDIVASVHFYPHIHSVERFCKIREQSFNELSKRLAPDMPKIHLASEAQFCDGFQRIDGIEQLCIENTNTLLVEMPSFELSDFALDGLYDLQENKNIKIIIVHPERYSKSLVSKLIDYGFLFQVNVGGICSLRTRKFCMELINEDKVAAIGTDIHGHGKNYRDYLKAVKMIGSKASKIQQSSYAMLKGNDL